MRFISPKTDFAFKKIFGSNDSKDILISFLNALLYEGSPTIQDLEIIDPYSSGTIVGLKDSYLDVKARLDTQEIVIIEMQVLNVAAFDKRVVYNAAKMYSNQLGRREGYLKLKPVIALTITDFIMFDRHERVISKYRFKDVEDFIDYRNYELELVFVELPKFQKSLEELEELSDKWIYFLKNAPDLEMIPTPMQAIPALDKAMNIANQANLNLKELEDLDKREMFLQDQLGAVTKGVEIGMQRGMQQGVQQGIQQGIQQGMQQGVQQGQVQIVLRLLSRKFGELSQDLVSPIEHLEGDRLEALSDAIFELNSLEDLAQWLRENSQ